MSKEELIEELAAEITKKELVQQLAEIIATDKVEELDKQLKRFPNTVVLKEEYKHPKRPLCVGCPHPEGRYEHPSRTVCTLQIQEYKHPEKKQCLHDHSAEKINPLYCSLRTVRIKEDQITDLVHDATKIQGVTVDDSAIADGKVLKYVASSDNVEYSELPAGYTDEDAIAAVEGEETLDLAGVIPDSAYPNALLLDGSRDMIGMLPIIRALDTDVALTIQVSGDSFGRFNIRADGQLRWGAGNLTQDCFLWRVGPKFLRTDSMLDFSRSGLSQYVVSARVGTESKARFAMDVEGLMEWGAGGSSNRDVNLYRQDADILRTDDNVYIGTVNFNTRFKRETPRMEFGDRSTKFDVSLYRSAADVLKTDDAFDAASFKVAGVAGVDGDFTTVDGKTVTVSKGLITSIV